MMMRIMMVIKVEVVMMIAVLLASIDRCQSIPNSISSTRYYTTALLLYWPLPLDSITVVHRKPTKTASTNQEKKRAGTDLTNRKSSQRQGQCSP